MRRKARSPPSSFIDRIADQKRQLEARIAEAESGPARDDILKKLRQLDVAAHLNEWLASPGLQAPR